MLLAPITSESKDLWGRKSMKRRPQMIFYRETEREEEEEEEEMEALRFTVMRRKKKAEGKEKDSGCVIVANFFYSFSFSHSTPSNFSTLPIRNPIVSSRPSFFFYVSRPGPS